jgi:hypothetical protein
MPRSRADRRPPPSGSTSALSGGCRSSAAQPVALRPGEPGEAYDGARDRKQEVPAQPEEVRGRVDSQHLFDDPEGAVAGDVSAKRPGARMGRWRPSQIRPAARTRFHTSS